MPMRGELAPPASRSHWKVNANDELIWRQTWQQVCDAVSAIDPIILLFSGTGLLLSLCQAILDPSSAGIAAALAQTF
jgi:hypothetical protein